MNTSRAAVRDRRVRRTRRQLRQALLDLMADKAYDEITVQDVLDRADFGRATFYAHFRDKDDLLLSGFEELRETLRGAMAAYARGDLVQGSAAAGLAPTRALFEHVAEHRHLYGKLVKSRAAPLVLRYARTEMGALAREHFAQVAAARGTRPRVPVDVLAEYISGALVSVLMWWLENDTSTYSVTEMAVAFERVSPPALEAGLGETG